MKDPRRVSACREWKAAFGGWLCGEIAPADRANVLGSAKVVLTDDAKSYAHGCYGMTSQLVVVERAR